MPLFHVFAQVAYGTEAPEIRAETWVNSEGESLSQNAGVYTVIHFWATWCPPCRQIMPVIVELQAQYSDTIRFVGLTEETIGASEALQYVQEVGISHPIGLGSRSMATFGIRSIPHAFVIDPNGVVVWQGHPAREAFANALEKAAEGTLRVQTLSEMPVTEIQLDKEGEFMLNPIVGETFRDHLVRLFSLDIAADTTVIVAVSSDDFDAQVGAYVEDTVLQWNDDWDSATIGDSYALGTTDAAIKHTFENNARVLLMVTSYDGLETGRFTLSATGQQ